MKIKTAVIILAAILAVTATACGGNTAVASETQPTQSIVLAPDAPLAGTQPPLPAEFATDANGAVNSADAQAILNAASSAAIESEADCCFGDKTADCCKEENTTADCCEEKI